MVAPGTGEAMAVALALGVVPGRVALSLGASTTALAGLADPIADPTGAVRSRADASGRHLAIATAPGGATLIDAIGDLLSVDAEELGALARAAPAGGGVVLVPGIPGRDGAVLTGLGRQSTRPGLARAAFEGVACAALDTLDLLTDAGAPWDGEDPIRLTVPDAGHGAHARIMATLAGCPVVPAPAGSLAAAGACVQAAAVLASADPAAVSEGWGLGAADPVDPEDDPDRLARRLAHAEERARQRRALLDPG